MLTTNAIAKPIVQRFRLRSTSEPPPNGPGAGADAERAGQSRVLARVHQHEEDQDNGDEHLDDAEDRGHRCEMVAVASASRREHLALPSSSSACRISIASARSVRSTASKSASDSLPVLWSSSASRISRYLASRAASSSATLPRGGSGRRPARRAAAQRRRVTTSTTTARIASTIRNCQHVASRLRRLARGDGAAPAVPRRARSAPRGARTRASATARSGRRRR